MPPGAPASARVARGAAAALLLAGLLACGACSTVGFYDDDAVVTGSISPRPAPTPVSAPVPEGAAPEGIADADWIEAKRALEQALTSREKDVSIPWEQKTTGAHGTSTPIGPERAGGCRDFMISVVDDKAADRWIQGTACRSGRKVTLSQVRLLDRA